MIILNSHFVKIKILVQSNSMVIVFQVMKIFLYDTNLVGYIFYKTYRPFQRENRINKYNFTKHVRLIYVKHDQIYIKLGYYLNKLLNIVLA